MPSLVGKTEAEATEMLKTSGLTLKVSSKQFSSEVPEGHVVEQIPASGTRLKTNRNVKVLLSLGEPSICSSKSSRYEPSGGPTDADPAAVDVGNTLYAHTSVGGPSTVVYQSPQPGTLEGTDPSVNILISLGPASEYFIMPDLIGKPAEISVARPHRGIPNRQDQLSKLSGGRSRRGYPTETAGGLSFVQDRTPFFWM